MDGKEKIQIHVSQVSTPEAPEFVFQRTNTVARYGPSYRERHWTLRLFLLLLDVLLALSPLVFILIASGAILYNNVGIHNDKQESTTVLGRTFRYTDYSGGSAIQQAARVAVSIFPIIFAAIVGRFLKAYALYRAEHGSRMGILEQLYGSQSLANAVQIGCALRGPNVLGLGLILFWALSPLGGQAVQRVLSTTPYTFLDSTTIYYCNTSSVNVFGSKLAYAYGSESIDVLLSTALMTNRFSRAKDVYGNVKVPFVNYSENQSKSEAFHLVSNESEFSSMIGTIINVIDSRPQDETFSMTTNFEMLTSHLELACDDRKIFKFDTFTNNTDTNAPGLQGLRDFIEWAGPLYLRRNLFDVRWSTFSSLLDVRMNGTFQSLDPSYAQPLPQVMFTDPPQFIYAVQQDAAQTRDGVTDDTTANDTTIEDTRSDDTTIDRKTVERVFPHTLMAYQCSSKLVWVRSNVTCHNAGSCIINGVRDDSRLYSHLKHPLFDTSLIVDSYTPLLLFLQVLDRFKQTRIAGWNTDVAQSPINPLDWYLAGVESPYKYNIAQPPPNLRPASGANLSRSLGSLLNTIFLAGIQNGALAEPASTNVSALNASDARSQDYALLSTAPVGYNVIPTRASTTYITSVYMVNKPFTAATIVLSLLLMGLGFLSIYIRQKNSYPDVLGFVSTLTRDNPAFNPPPEAEKLDGLDMARYYKHVSVQLVNTASLGDGQPRITLRRAQVARSEGV